MTNDVEKVPEIRIRRFVPEDQVEARTLILKGLEEHFGLIDETLNPDLDDIAGHYLDRGHAFFLALLGGELVGTGALVREAPGIGRMARITVDSARRRQGIAKLMVRHLKDWAQLHGCRRILVETNHDWHEAITLYLGEGFEEVYKDDESIHMAFQWE